VYLTIKNKRDNKLDVYNDTQLLYDIRFLYGEKQIIKMSYSECKMTDDEMIKKAYEKDTKRNNKMNKQKQEINRLIDMDVLQETPEEHKKRIKREQIQRYRLKLKSKLISVDEI
jgi:hypothetical protein